MTRWIGGLMAAAAAMTVVAAAPAIALAGDPLDKPAFTATAKELLAAAAAAPAGDWPVVVLREDDTRTLDADGRIVKRWRLVFVVRSQAGVDSWGTLGAGYSPFYQDRPAIKARVIGPDGAIAELDQALVTEAPSYAESSTVFSDARDVQAPLPRLRIGSVIEEELTTIDRVPLLAAGTTSGIAFGNTVPTLSTRVTVSAPIALRLKRSEHGVPVGARRTATKDRETWTYAVGTLDPTPEDEPFSDGDAYVRPYLGFATGASWAAVAKGYGELVDAKLAAGPVALPAGIKPAATLATAQAIVRWLHEHVRYTGIEFGQATIVPWQPDQTEQRGFGDCKDKATLLIALLRKAGIDADLALVWTGPGLDVDPALPGLGGFDHAIVRARIAGRDLWIDATEDLVAVGRLPPRDQGRRALIVDAATTALVTTPADAPADSVVREVRTFTLSENGTGEVTEVSREGGVFEAALRGWLRDTRAEDVTKSLTSYAATEYGGALADYKPTDPSDLATPFQLTTRITRTRRAYTSRHGIEVLLYPSAALAKLPSTITDDAEADAPARRAAFVWYEPHVYEVENRLVLPPGYTLPSLPGDRTVRLGPATLTERNRLDGRTVVVTYRFDSGKRTLAPAELAALRTAVRTLRAEERTLTIEHTGWALSGQGKHAEAIAEVERLIKLHPKEAVHHTELAHLLLHVGMGSAARRAARKAVALEPTSADAYAVLGWVLRYDTVGREHGFDLDRKAAIAALRKARTLQPDHLGAAVELARALEVGDDGRLWDAGADLRGAAAQWRAAYDLDGSEVNATGLLRSLLASGDYAGCEAIARARPAAIATEAYLVAAVALRDGTARAVVAGDALRSGAERRQLYDTAAGLAMLVGKYDAARELHTHGAADPNTDRLVSALAPVGKPRAPGKDPAAVVRALAMSVSLLGGPAAPYLDAAVAADLRPDLEAAPSASTAGVPLRYLRDSMAAILQLATDGRKAGPWRVRLTSSVGTAAPTVIFVGLDHGHAVVIGSPLRRHGIGRYARRLLDAGDLEGAQALLDWLIKDAPRANLTKVWGGGQPRDAATATLAAALLTGDTGGDPEIAVLAACKSSAADARETCDNALGGLYLQRRRLDDAIAHAEAWQKRAGAGWPAAASLRASALSKLGRYDDADQALAPALRAVPDDELLVRTSCQIALDRGRIDDAAARWAARANASPSPDASDLNNAAWAKLVAGADLVTARGWAEQAVRLAPTEGPMVNTLAALEAELGDLDGAVRHVWQALVLEPRRAPTGAEYYVFGRIAEQLGLRDDAIAAYRKVATDDEHPAISTYALAGKRLAGLGAKR